MENLLAVGIYVLVVGVVFKNAIRYITDEKKRKALGAGKIPAYPQWDPIFGLDMAWSQMKALKGHYYIPWLRDIHAGQPKTFSIKFLNTRQIYTTEPENLKAMTAVVWKDFGISPLRRFKNIGYPFGDKGVNTTDGDDWVFSRFLIKPFFNREVYTSSERLRGYTDHFLRILPPDGQTLNVQPYFQRWFLDVTTDFIFGEPMDALTHPDRARITWAMLDVLRGIRLKIQLWKAHKLFDWTWWNSAVHKVHKYTDAHIDRAYKEIKERKRASEAGEDVGPERTDLLWFMASNLDDREELRSQLCLLLVPNNDTTSIFISNCIWHLARNPDAWEKCRQEVLAHGDGPLTFESLRGMKYVQGILNETHRLNPNNVTQVRACVKDTTLPLGGGKDGKSPIFVRKGDMVQVTKTVLQRDPDYFDSHNVDDFVPDRWLDSRHYWNFVPFGGGPRRCPAQMMVMTETAYMVARLAQTYRKIEARDDNEYTAVMRVGPSNKTGVLVAFTK
ncbi:Cytochrome P450 [Akanthomyces lecanii RCEF 1005]|uniref:Cytochrome P450 n=1 Tax=Akanthomyces lecanii RCEF 1005 TaxID=1081108 RepID=A0A167RSS0_CORDF|nr:Cytochrome P450 [Akanthomyces lecanii RCEF 1005]